MHANLPVAAAPPTLLPGSRGTRGTMSKEVRIRHREGAVFTHKSSSLCGKTR